MIFMRFFPVIIMNLNSVEKEDIIDVVGVIF